MKKTANSFGIGKFTVSSIIKNATEISKHLGPKFIKLPLTENQVEQLTYYCFEKVHGFPCLDAVGRTHGKITILKNNPTDFINRKDQHSINVQACLDYNYSFFDVVVKWTGNVHEARIWGDSSINQKFKDGAIPECF